MGAHLNVVRRSVGQWRRAVRAQSCDVICGREGWQVLPSGPAICRVLVAVDRVDRRRWCAERDGELLVSWGHRQCSRDGWRTFRRHVGRGRPRACSSTVHRADLDGVVDLVDQPMSNEGVAQASGYGGGAVHAVFVSGYRGASRIGHWRVRHGRLPIAGRRGGDRWGGRQICDQNCVRLQHTSCVVDTWPTGQGRGHVK